MKVSEFLAALAAMYERHDMDRDRKVLAHDCREYAQLAALMEARIEPR